MHHTCRAPLKLTRAKTFTIGSTRIYTTERSMHTFLGGVLGAGKLRGDNFV
jgi:hypothetical protein